MRLPRKGPLRTVYLLVSIFIAVLILLNENGLLETTKKSAQQNQPGLYNVEEVSDGDTIIVNMNGTREIVRFIGVDTPETHRPNSPVQCYGPEASEFTRKLLEGKQVRLQADPENTNRDRYDRLLRYVYLPDGTLVEKNLISEGYGFSYTQFPFEKAEEFDMYESQAKNSKKGLWSACQVTVEDSGREQTNDR